MNKLQKLLEAGVIFEIKTFEKTTPVDLFFAGLYAKNGSAGDRCRTNSIDEVLNFLWASAKKHYPDADCFKNEEKSNFEKWKDFFNNLPPFMCDRFCEVLAKKFDEAGLDAELILECFKEEK